MAGADGLIVAWGPRWLNFAVDSLPAERNRDQPDPQELENIFGFSTEMFYLPEHDATVIVTVNRLDEDDHSQHQSISSRF